MGLESGGFYRIVHFINFVQQKEIKRILRMQTKTIYLIGFWDILFITFRLQAQYSGSWTVIGWLEDYS